MSTVTIALKIDEFQFEPSKITDALQLIPTNYHVKGEEYFTGPPERRSMKTYDVNYWEYRISIRENAVWISTIFNQFIKEVIDSKRELFDNLKNDCKLEIYIGLGYIKGERLESFHFDIEILKLLTQLNIEIDIDQHVLWDK